MEILLKNKNTTAKISTMGAQLCSFKREDGFEILWQGDPKYWSGRAPVLFPIIGALRGGKTEIEGEIYNIDRHGFARKMEFDVLSKSETHVDLCLKSSDKTKEFYPYDFIFTVSYLLCDKGITTKFSTKNTGDKEMCFCVGGHPAFNVPLAKGEKFDDYELVFECEENIDCPRIDMNECLIDFKESAFKLKNKKVIPVKHSLFYSDALVFENLKSNYVSIVSKKSNTSLTMDISNFKMLGVWSAQNDAPFVALEPWVGCATTTDESDEFSKKRHMIFLNSKQTKEFEFTVCYDSLN